MPVYWHRQEKSKHMEHVIEIAEWVVWGIAMLLGFAFLMNRHKDGGVALLSRRYAILVLAGALITFVTDISKFHLLWWMPIAYFLNMYLFTIIVQLKMKSFENNLMNAKGGRPNIEQDSGFNEENDDDEEYDFVRDMLAAYLKVSREYIMYRVVDESRLPFKKEDLKAAIKLMMWYQDSDSTKEDLREVYYQLSKYQPDSETLENVQRLCMEAYEELIKLEGTDIDEDEKLAGLLDAAENHLDLEDIEAVDHEKELLVAELELWEAKLEVEEAKQELEEIKQEIKDYISSLGDKSE